jgi:hypothetical protein
MHRVDSEQHIGQLFIAYACRTHGLRTCITLSILQVLDSKVVGSLLRRACKARATAATESNERSSRSHSVFTLKVRGVNEATQQETEGASERVLFGLGCIFVPPSLFVTAKACSKSRWGVLSSFETA